MSRADDKGPVHIEPLPVTYDFDDEDVERETPTWTPRPPQPFEPGNMPANTSHGVWSERLVSERAQRVLADLQAVCPWIMDADGMVLDTLIKAKVRHDALDDVIVEYMAEERRDAKGMTGIEAIPERIWQQVSREGRHVMDACGKLGLTATDRAALMKDTSWARALAVQNGGASQVGEQGRKLREERGRA